MFLNPSQVVGCIGVHLMLVIPLFYLVLIIWTKVFIVVEYYSKKRASVVVRTSDTAHRL